MPQAGYVYIVHGIGTHFIKIGKTTNLFERLRALEQGVPFSLQLLSAQLVSDMDRAERTLLTSYEAYKTRGEWFALPRDLLIQWPIDTPLAPLLLQEQLRQPRHASRSVEAAAWLQDYLHAGECRSLDIFAAATAVGIST